MRGLGEDYEAEAASSHGLGCSSEGGSEKAGRPLSRFVRDKRLIPLSHLLELSKVTGETAQPLFNGGDKWNAASLARIGQDMGHLLIEPSTAAANGLFRPLTQWALRPKPHAESENFTLAVRFALSQESANFTLAVSKHKAWCGARIDRALPEELN